MLRAVTLGKIRRLQSLLRTYLYALSAVVALTVIYHGKIVDHLDRSAFAVELTFLAADAGILTFLHSLSSLSLT